MRVGVDDVNAVSLRGIFAGKNVVAYDSPWAEIINSTCAIARAIRLAQSIAATYGNESRPAFPF